MAYTVRNYKTKKQLKADLLAGEVVYVYQPGPFGDKVPDGETTLEGPHYPAMHTWYSRAVVKDDRIVRLINR